MTRNSRILWMLLGSAWLILAASRGRATELVPAGPEIRLATGPAPEGVVLAVRPDRAYAIAWSDLPSKVLVQHVADGAEPAEERPAPIWNGTTPSVDGVTATAEGFDVNWHVRDSNEVPVGFYVRHLDSRGAPTSGKPRLLGRIGIDWAWSLGAAGDPYLVGWTLPLQHGIAARRLDSAGQPAGPAFRLNSRAVEAPSPTVMPLAGGGFVAIWFGEISLGEGEDLTLKVLRARLFSPAGRPLGPDFDVNTIRPGTGETLPSLSPQFQVAAAPAGGFAVSWALGDTIYLRSFDAAGHAPAPEVAAVTTAGAYVPSSLAFDPSGNLALLWVLFLDDSDLRLQLFDSHGAPLGPATAVRSAASGGFEAPRQGSVAWGGDSWLVSWVAGLVGKDPRAVFVRRFVEP
jgi:hypothetical protein